MGLSEIFSLYYNFSVTVRNFQAKNFALHSEKNTIFYNRASTNPSPPLRDEKKPKIFLFVFYIFTASNHRRILVKFFEDFHHHTCIRFIAAHDENKYVSITNKQG